MRPQFFEFAGVMQRIFMSQTRRLWKKKGTRKTAYRRAKFFDKRCFEPLMDNLDSNCFMLDEKSFNKIKIYTNIVHEFDMESWTYVSDILNTKDAK